MKLAVVGLGIGAVHAQVMAGMEEVELVGVCDLNAELATKVAADCSTAAFTDFGAMLEEARPEGVSLCTNPKTHLPMGQELASRGIHVLCEKPMAPTVEDCLALTEACEAAGVTLMIAQKKRFTPAAAFLKKHVGADFGRPLSLNYRYHPGQVPKHWFWQEDDGGGPILENAVHTFDTLRYAIGEIASIRGIGGNLLTGEYPEQIDIALGLLQFANGCVGAVELGTASEWCVADEEFFLACEKAIVRWRGGFDRPGEIMYVYRDAQEPKSLAIDYDGANATREFALEIGHFVGCARSGEPPLVGGRDAARSIACCLALKRAVREGIVVELG